MNYFLDASNLLTRRAKRYFRKDNQAFLELANYFKTIRSINSTAQYNNILQKIVSSAKNGKPLPIKNFPIYEKEILPISKSAPLTEKTAWGGVSLKKVDVEKNYIRKLLVIGRYGVLGFEIHKLKHERLKILEGACIVLYSNHGSRNWEPGKITVKLGVPGDKFEFLPNDEHGIIALSNAVIEERSTNHLDDLVYIFKAS